MTIERPAISAACGAWEYTDHSHAHDQCRGIVSLPPPDDTCTCWCHGEHESVRSRIRPELTAAEQDLFRQVYGHDPKEV